MIEFLISIKPLLVIIHALCAAVGLGAVVVTDALFFTFLENFRISQKEDKVLKTISRLIWIAIILLAVSGACLYLTSPLDYLAKSKFVVKVIIFAVIVINGVVLNWVLTPYLKRISFGPVIHEPSRRIRFLRRLAFASGAVSVVSWFSVFLLGSLRSIPLTVWEGVSLYVLLSSLAVLGSQIYATWVKHRKTS